MRKVSIATMAVAVVVLVGLIVVSFFVSDNETMRWGVAIAIVIAAVLVSWYLIVGNRNQRLQREQLRRTMPSDTIMFSTLSLSAIQPVWKFLAKRQGAKLGLITFFTGTVDHSTITIWAGGGQPRKVFSFPLTALRDITFSVIRDGAYTYTAPTLVIDDAELGQIGVPVPLTSDDNLMKSLTAEDFAKRVSDIADRAGLLVEDPGHPTP